MIVPFVVIKFETWPVFSLVLCFVSGEWDERLSMILGRNKEVLWPSTFGLFHSPRQEMLKIVFILKLDYSILTQLAFKSSISRN